MWMEKDKVADLAHCCSHVKLRGSSFALVLPGSERFECLMLRDVLSSNDVIGRQCLVTLHLMGKVNGWCKGCETEGLVHPDQLRWFLKRVSAQEG